jgi:hypothetical protein
VEVPFARDPGAGTPGAGARIKRQRDPAQTALAIALANPAAVTTRQRARNRAFRIR